MPGKTIGKNFNFREKERRGGEKERERLLQTLILVILNAK
jgi:hypothetical protein